MKLYPAYFICFTCGETGDIIALVQRLHGYSRPIEAARLLDNDFKLNLFKDKLTPAEYKQVKEAAKKRERDKLLADNFDKWCKQAIDTLIWYLQYLEHIKANNYPKSINEKLNEDYIRALMDIDKADYVFSLLALGEFTERIKACNHWK